MMKIMKPNKQFPARAAFYGLLLVVCCVMASSVARAACSNPAGNAGEIVYNSAHVMMQYCDGSNDWIAMSNSYVPNAVYFDGSNDILAHTPMSAKASTDNDKVTISLWVLPVIEATQVLWQGSGNGRIQVMLNDDGTPGNGLVEIYFHGRNAADATIISVSTTAFAVNQWHHLLISLDAGNNVSHLYLDDTLNEISEFINPANGNIDFDTQHNLSTGGAKIGAGMADVWIDVGTYIDFSVEENRRKFIAAGGMPVYLGSDGSNPTGTAPDIFLTGDTANWHTNKGLGGGFTENGALTDAPSSPPSGLSADFMTGLVGHWKLDETSGTSVSEEVSANDGTMVGGLDAANDSVTGPRSTGLNFDGVDDVITLPDDMMDGYATGSICAWALIDHADDDDVNDIFAFGDDAGTGYFLDFHISDYSGADMQLTLVVRRNGVGNQYSEQANGYLTRYEWNHVCAVQDGTGVQLYANGAAASSIRSTAGAGTPDSWFASIATEAENVTIGAADRGGFNRFFKGHIDDVRIYNRALTATDVKALYLNSSGFCANPNGASGEIHYDVTGKEMMFCAQGSWLSMNTNYRPNAVSFDGTNDHLYLGSLPTAPTATTKWSGSFWIKRGRTGHSIDEEIADSGSIDYSVTLNTDDRLYFSARNSATTTVLQVYSDPISDTDWHHVMFSFDLSDTGKRHIYIDGVSAYNATGTYNTAETMDFTATDHRVGAGGGPSNLLLGDLADFWMEFGTYVDLSVLANREKFIKSGHPVFLGESGNIPLSTTPDIFLSGVTANWHLNKGEGGGFTENGALTDALTAPPLADSAPSLTTGLVSHWKLDEISGTTVTDEQGTNNGSMINMDGLANSSAGVYGSALMLNGTDEYMNVPHNASLNFASGQNFAIALWLKSTQPPVLDEYPLIIGKQDTGSPRDDFEIGLHNSTNPNYFASIRIADTPYGLNGDSDLADGAWHHLAFIRDGFTLKLYQDGVLIDTTTNPNISHPVTNTSPLRMGRSGFSSPYEYWFDGELDDVRIYNRALTDAEVKQLFVGACTGPAAAGGTMVYNTSESIMQYCNGRDWVGIGK